MCITDFNTCWNFQHAFNIVFNMHYRFQHVLKFSTCFFNMLSTKFSTCITDFNMHYRFQHVLKFLTCFLKMFSTHFKHEIHLCYEPCWKLCWKPCQIFQSVLKTMWKTSRHVKNHVNNFKVYQKSLWCDHYVTLSINFET